MSASLLLDEVRLPRLIGIDPGTTTLGLCCSEIDGDTLNVLDAYTVNTDLLVRRHYELLVERFGMRHAQLHAAVEAILQYIRTWGSDMVAYESPYLGRHPQAYGSGVEIMTLVRDAIVRESQFMVFHVMDPARVKTAVGVSGKSGDKDLIAQGLKKSKFLRFSIDIDLLDEHARDSIAVSLAVYRNRGKA